MEIIEKYLPRDRDAFDSDPPLQSHIYRHLMLIGEAAWRLSPQFKKLHPLIPWRQIEGMRHVMVHDYFRVDWDIVFTTARDDLPPLKGQIRSIYESFNPKSAEESG